MPSLNMLSALACLVLVIRVDAAAIAMAERAPPQLFCQTLNTAIALLPDGGSVRGYCLSYLKIARVTSTNFVTTTVAARAVSVSTAQRTTTVQITTTTSTQTIQAPTVFVSTTVSTSTSTSIVTPVTTVIAAPQRRGILGLPLPGLSLPGLPIQLPGADLSSIFRNAASSFITNLCECQNLTPLTSTVKVTRTLSQTSTSLTTTTQDFTTTQTNTATALTTETPTSTVQLVASASTVSTAPATTATVQPSGFYLQVTSDSEDAAVANQYAVVSTSCPISDYSPCIQFSSSPVPQTGIFSVQQDQTLFSVSKVQPVNYVPARVASFPIVGGTAIAASDRGPIKCTIPQSSLILDCSQTHVGVGTAYEAPLQFGTCANTLAVVNGTGFICSGPTDLVPIIKFRLAPVN